MKLPFRACQRVPKRIQRVIKQRQPALLFRPALLKFVLDECRVDEFLMLPFNIAERIRRRFLSVGPIDDSVLVEKLTARIAPVFQSPLWQSARVDPVAWDDLNLRITVRSCPGGILKDLSISVNCDGIEVEVVNEITGSGNIANLIPFRFQPLFCSPSKGFILAPIDRQPRGPNRKHRPLVGASDENRRAQIERFRC